MRNHTTPLGEHADFGDARLNARLTLLDEQLRNKLEYTLPQALPEPYQMKAAYRFFSNEKVNSEEIIKAQRQRFDLRSKIEPGEETLLLIQDTTDIDLTTNRVADAGVLNYDKRRGCKMHTTLAVQASKGVPLCVFKQDHIVRSDDSLGKTAKRKYDAVEDKESYRWITHQQAMVDYFEDQPEREVISVCDKEADFHDLLASPRSPNVHYLIASKYNRKDDYSGNGIWEQVAKQPSLGTTKVRITQPQKRTTKEITMELRCYQARISLRHPKAYQKKLGSVELSVIEARKVSPETGKAIVWRLLSSKPVHTFEQARTMLEYYTRRWLIERFHYVLKSGAHIEELQLDRMERILNAIALYSGLACDHMRMNYFARREPDTTIDQVGIGQQKHQALYVYANQVLKTDLKYRPDKPPTVYEYIRLIGRIGGFRPSKRQPLPGLKTLWRGILEFNRVLEMFKALQTQRPETYG
jgi:hypothetical protein